MNQAQEDYIIEKSKEFAMNISDFCMGQVVADTDGKECSITGLTTNSIEVLIERKSDKGVDCKNWFSMNQFNRRFKLR